MSEVRKHILENTITVSLPRELASGDGLVTINGGTVAEITIDPDASVFVKAHGQHLTCSYRELYGALVGTRTEVTMPRD